MILALALVLVAVVLTVLLRNAPEQAVASEQVAKTKSLAGSLIRGEGPVKPWREKARSLPAPGDPNSESGPTPAPRTEKTSRPEPVPRPEPKPTPQAPTVGEHGWTRPTPQEVEAANRPRYYSLPAGAIMGLTMGSIGIYDAPVFDSASPMALAKGVAHLPDTAWAFGGRGAACSSTTWTS